jgi:hypothetical protein
VLAGGADRPADEHVAAGDLARVARELHARRVDALHVVREVVLRQLATVRAERVRLDQLGSGVDEADVDGDHGLRRPQVRFLGVRRPETAAVSTTPIPPSATSGASSCRRVRKRLDTGPM